ncbi:MAG: DUF115 domain-containing protein [Planctomycetota bacterium]|nr:MAG: DUF115 domain-containing protein [Planctomycetota bacterium]
MTTGTESAVGQELYLRNMRALWRVDPALAIRIDAVFDDQRLPLEPARRGGFTARLTAPDGQPIYLHSRYDPQAEARRFVEGVQIEEKFCFVVSGMGLGYHVRALLDRLRGDTLVLCVEPLVEVIASAFCCVDLSDALARRRLIILVDDDKARLHALLQPLNTLIMLGAEFVSHAPSQRVAGRRHAVITRAVAEFVTYTRMTLVTLLANARITCRNIAMNLVTYVQTPPIDLLKNRFAGDPAVIIAAGPSLARNIDRLAELKGRAVLCAVQTTLKPLLQRGIVPDFVTSLDFHEMSRTFFEGAGDLHDVHLVAEPKATWHVVDAYPGPISLLDNHWARLLLGNALAARDGLKAGATVAHLAFYLAVYMGCDPIIFVGQDLAYTGGVFYVPGVEIHQAWRSELNRFCTLEQKEWERIVRNRPILMRVPGNQGGELYTDELLFTYLEQFEKDIAEVSCRVVNATEGGARIRGTTSLTLEEATRRFCRHPIDPRRFAYRKETTWRDPSRLAPAAEELSARLAELDEAERVCDELLAMFEELKTLTDDPPRFNRRLVRVDELRAKVHQESRAYRLVNSFTQQAELRRFSADRRISTADLSDAERAKRQLERDTEFITGVRDGAKELKPILQESLQRIVEARSKTG